MDRCTSSTLSLLLATAALSLPPWVRAVASLVSVSSSDGGGDGLDDDCTRECNEVDEDDFLPPGKPGAAACNTDEYPPVCGGAAAGADDGRAGTDGIEDVDADGPGLEIIAEASSGVMYPCDW